MEISCPATSPYGNGTYTAKGVYSYDGQNWYPLEMGYYAPISVTFTITGGPSLYTITVNSANTEMGTVSGGGSYAAGSQVSISATAKPGYRFAHWNDGNTQTPRTINVTNNATYTAYFEADGGGYNAIDEVAAHEVKLYPNPTSGVLRVDVDALQSIDVIDAIGRTVLHETGSNSIDMSALDNGIYTVRIMAGDNTTIKKVALRK